MQSYVSYPGGCAVLLNSLNLLHAIIFGCPECWNEPQYFQREPCGIVKIKDATVQLLPLVYICECKASSCFVN